MRDMILKFGKYKGVEFEKTPQNYQKWLLAQDWFNAPKSTNIVNQYQSVYNQLKGWDGYSRRGQASYDALFELEKAEMAKQDCRSGICSCCVDSAYYGL